MSDIRVSVQWRSSSIFAGEDLECVITFKNVAHVQQIRNSLTPSSHLRGQASGRERWKESLPQQGTNKSFGNTLNSSFTQTGLSQETLKVHKPALSLTSPISTRHNSSTSLNQAAPAGHDDRKAKHRRSISIVSIVNDPYHGRTTQDGTVPPSRPDGRGHARAASLQVLPRRGGMRINGPTSGKQRRQR